MIGPATCWIAVGPSAAVDSLKPQALLFLPMSSKRPPHVLSCSPEGSSADVSYPSGMCSSTLPSVREKCEFGALRAACRWPSDGRCGRKALS